ncbi:MULTISPECIES: hypothetical protein [unclassified Micromonospora]|uniref:hypothetical protein n=1 Tax=unclassified Micromonospora TaxID=2617518 RepID=UPI0036359F52
MALLAGIDKKVVQELLGRPSYSLMANTYVCVLPELAMEAAEATARLVPRRRTKGTAGPASGSRGANPSKGGAEKDRKKSKKRQVSPAV